MAPVVKVRQALASKAGAKGAGTDVKGSTPLTPLQRLRLQSRTATPTATPSRGSKSIEHEPTSTDAAPSAADATAVGDGQGKVATHPGQDAQVAQLKLTLLQAPLLPKPEVTRPAPPADPKALMQRLHDLRAAGNSLLEAADKERYPGPGPGPGPYSGTAPSPSGPSRWSLQGPAATLSPHVPLSLQSPVRHSHAVAAASTVGPAASARSYQQQQPRTPYNRPASPYGGGPAGFGAAQPPCLSSSSMAGLRQREQKDTGGGFLTHFADPRDISTPPPSSHGGRGGPAGGGSSTPLSVLRSIHRLQQLQRLQREGSQLVAAMEGSDGAGCGAAAGLAAG